MVQTDGCKQVTTVIYIFLAQPKHFLVLANVDISKEKTPTIYKMLETSLVDLGLSTYTAKNKYQRVRPFISNGQGICEISAADREKFGITYQENKEKLATDGSYPSGHSAIGWAGH